MRRNREEALRRRQQQTSPPSSSRATSCVAAARSPDELVRRAVRSGRGGDDDRDIARDLAEDAEDRADVRAFGFASAENFHEKFPDFAGRALFIAQTRVSRAHRKAISFAHGGNRYDFRINAKIAHHFLNNQDLLEVFRAKKSEMRPNKS